jgi:hypothetical protein
MALKCGRMSDIIQKLVSCDMSKAQQMSIYGPAVQAWSLISWRERRGKQALTSQNSMEPGTG